MQITSITAMICNDNGNDLFEQRKYAEAAQACRHLVTRRAASRSSAGGRCL